jgi:hypothetical protein
MESSGQPHAPPTLHQKKGSGVTLLESRWLPGSDLDILEKKAVGYLAPVRIRTPDRSARNHFTDDGFNGNLVEVARD